MRYVLLIDNLNSGGAQKQMLYLSNLLANQSNEVHLVHYGKEDFYDKSSIVQLHNIDHKIKFFRILNFRKIIKKLKPEVVISFLETPNFIACVSSIICKKWILITSERNATEASFKGFKNTIYKFSERFSDQILCNSVTAANLWKLHYPKFSNKISVIHNCVPDYQKFPDLPSYTIRYNDKTNIIIVASFKDAKNPLGFINALNLVDKTILQKLKFDWYGSEFESDNNNQLYIEFMKKIKEYNLESVIHVYPPKKDIYKDIWKSDVLALFSKHEGLPNVVAEAMSLSKPIIMTRVSDYELLVSKDNGVLCDWFDLVSIKDAITSVTLLDDDSLISMGIKSKAKAETMLTCGEYIKKWNKLICDLINKDR